MRNTVTPHQMEPPGIGPKKTLFVLMTVVGCIAILWPKVFYPMMIGGGTPKQPAIKGHHGTVACCDVVIDRDSFMNVSTAVREQSYRTKLGLLSGELSLRQERPPHLRADGIHPAMLEKGRAIPTTHTIPLVARPSQSAPIMVEGRPGPIPGLRPPLGAGSVHKAQPKGSSMGFVMPLYTVGIIAFFVYTIMKLLFKKPVANAPYGQARVDPTFRKEVFNQEPLIKRPNDGTTKLGLIDAADEQIKRREATNGPSKGAVEQTSLNSNLVNGHAKTIDSNGKLVEKIEEKLDVKAEEEKEEEEADEKPVEISEIVEKKDVKKIEPIETNKSDHSNERSVQVLGMELTASCEGGQRWGRPPTPVFTHRPDIRAEEEPEKTESIFLEGSLPRESQILVTDSETRTENVLDDELNGSSDEPAVVLSSKMTLSLINLSTGEEAENSSTENDSPLADDMEIIDGSEKEEDDDDLDYDNEDDEEERVEKLLE